MSKGLYDPQLEHDSCGVGCITNFKGIKSHAIVKDALTMLENMEHRGATGSDPDTGDGAGILIQIPHDFLEEQLQTFGIPLPTSRSLWRWNGLLPSALWYERALQESHQ